MSAVGHTVTADAYAKAIALDVRFMRPAVSETTDEQLTAEIADWLLGGSQAALRVPALESERRSLIKRLLTVRPPQPIPEEVQKRIDRMLAEDADHRAVVMLRDALNVPGPSWTTGGTVLKVWRGDVTTLAVDAIVNAANSALLGCFRPFHPCIDNAIHNAAGPQLRADCARIIALQGHDEPTGTAKITRAYHLPSRYVLHTVGPIVPGGTVEPQHAVDLARCYEACLELAATRRDVRSIAFCCISTGVFGYPKDAAAIVATQTVTAWLERHPGCFEAIVFDVFTTADEVAYREAGVLS